MRNSVTVKRPKHATAATVEEEEDELDHQCLIPGIPDHIAQLCLSSISPSVLNPVCRSWRRLIYAPSFPAFPSIYALLLPIGSHPHQSNLIQFSSFDPICCKWKSLPPPPPLRLLFRHPSFISWNLPVQSLTVSGSLVVVAATNDQFLPALPQPLVFNPQLKEWCFGPPLSAPRRWCAAGAFDGSVYVASGMGAHFNNDVARSVEKWNLIDNESVEPRLLQRRRWIWEKMGNLKDSKFSREAIDAIGYRGKLCMVNVKGDAAKEGIMYDVVSDSWREMPEGLLGGWRGPAAVMEEKTIYAVDESRGSLRRYDEVMDRWEEVVESDVLKGAQHAAAGGGKVCVVCGDGRSIAVVDTAAVRVWKVEAPDELQVIAIHILPRLCGSD